MSDSEPKRQKVEMEEVPVCIIGSGPAGHTAAIYAARAELKPLMFEGNLDSFPPPGGQLMTTTDLENFPGFPDGVHGSQFCDNLKKQTEKFGTKVYSEDVTSIDLSKRPFIIKSSKRTVKAQTVIIATGATAKRLSFPGSDTYWNQGISACAVCDGALPMFRKKPLIVIGGGDSAMEEATFLTKYASKVSIVHRRDTFRASKIMQQRVLENPKIEVVWNCVPVEAHGDSKGLLSALSVKDVNTGKISKIECSGLFFAIGHKPSTDFLGGQVELDEDGYIKTKPGEATTSISGVFACGDVQDKRWRQAITAAGSGCIAALQAEHFLSSHL